MPYSDGALIVDTGMNNSGFFRDARAFKAAVQSLKQNVDRTGRDMGKSGSAYMRAVQGDIKASREFRAELQRLESEARRMRDALDKPGTGSKAYQQIVDTIKKTENAFDEAVKRRDALTEKDPMFKGWNMQVEMLAERLEKLNTERDRLANPTAKDWADYQNMVNQYNAVVAKIEEMRGAANDAGMGFANIAKNAGVAFGQIVKMAGSGAWTFLRKLATGARNAAIQLARLAGRAISNGIHRIGSAAASAAKSIFGLNRNARRTHGGFKRGLMTVLKYGLGIRSLYVLFNRLRQAIKDGFGELAKVDPQVKQQLATLKTALGGLKGSLAAAFQPIFTAIAPALTTFISLLTRAINTVGQLFAALTGQSYYYAAKGIASVGDSASSASGNVKDLKRQLAGFDELNILSANSSSGGGGSDSASDVGFKYDKVSVAGGIADFVAELKRLFADGDYEGIGQIIADGLNSAVQKVQDWIKWDNIGPAITRIVDTAAGIFNGLIADFDWENLSTTLAEGVKTVLNGAERALTKFDFAQAARNLASALNNFIAKVPWDNLGKDIALYAGTVINALLAAVTTFDWTAAGQKLAAALNGFFKQKWIWTAAGDTINKALRGLLDFTQQLVINFDAVQAARDIKAALGRIEWGEIARQVWDTAKIAFQKAGSFIRVLLGGDVYDAAGDAVDQLWARGSGETSSKKYAQGIAQGLGSLFANVSTTLLDAIKWAIGEIDWAGLGEDIRQMLIKIDWYSILEHAMLVLKDVLSGLGDLFGSLLFGKENWANFKHEVEQTSKAFAEVAGKSLEDMLNNYETFKESGKVYDNPDVIPSLLSVLLAGNADKIEAAYNAKNGIGIYNRANDRRKQELQSAYLTASDYQRDTWKQRAQFLANGGDLAGWDALYNDNTQAIETNTKQNDALADVIETVVGAAVFGPTLPLVNGAIAEEDAAALEYAKQYAANTNALDKNTKATVAQVKGVKKLEAKTGTRTLFSSKHQALAYQLGADKQGTTLSQMNAQGVDVSVDFLPAGARNYINNLGGYLAAVFAPGTDTTARVALLRKGFETIAGWLGFYSGGDVDKPVGIIRNAFETVASWLYGSYMGGSVDKGVGVQRLGFNDLASWIMSSFMGGAVNKDVGVQRLGFSDLANWIMSSFMGGVVNKDIGVKRLGFSDLASWIMSSFMGGAVDKPVGLARLAWNTVQGYVQGYTGGAVDKSIGLARLSWNTVQGYVQSYMGGTVSSAVGLVRSGWTLLSSWANGYRGGEATSYVDLVRYRWSTLARWVDNNYQGGAASSPVELAKYGWSTVTRWAQQFAQTPITQPVVLEIAANAVKGAVLGAIKIVKAATGGAISATGKMLRFASGGMISGARASWWPSVRKYASGTGRAHGTLFAAGEAGPEIVGHVNGRTEILNKSQLAQTMASAVSAGMVAAMSRITFRMPAMATGSVMPYEVSAQIAKTGEDIQRTLDANNEDLIQTIISVIGAQTSAIVSALNATRQTGGGMNAQDIINEINRRTQMFSASPLKGV